MKNKKEKLFLISIFFCILLVAVVTISPFDFDFARSSGTSGWHLHIVELGETDVPDLFLNILLFIPFGFSLSIYLVHMQNVPKKSLFMLVLLLSFVLSYAVETMQIFLPRRFPALFDVFMNTIGGGVGFCCQKLWQRLDRLYFARLSRRYLTIIDAFSGYAEKRIPAIVFAYLCWAVAVTLSFQQSVRLQNWSSEFPLLIGNEQTGDRPWKGQVSAVLLYDRALSKEHIAEILSGDESEKYPGQALVVSYDFTRERHGDMSGHLPELVWKGIRDGTQPQSGVSLGHGSWLETAGTAAFLTKRIRDSGQFTIYVKAATHELFQTGPARIISLSKDPLLRNFTLGQQRRDLIFRLRTPLTGENGTNPQMTVPGVFSDKAFHKILVIYDSAAVRIYIDHLGSQHIFGLSPQEITLRSRYMENAPNLLLLKFLYYTGIFVPFGLLLSVFGHRQRNRDAVYGIGILLSPLLLELLLRLPRERGINVENLLIGMVAILTGVIFFHLLMQAMLRLSKAPQIVDEKEEPMSEVEK